MFYQQTQYAFIVFFRNPTIYMIQTNSDQEVFTQNDLQEMLLAQDNIDMNRWCPLS